MSMMDKLSGSRNTSDTHATSRSHSNNITPAKVLTFSSSCTHRAVSSRNGSASMKQYAGYTVPTVERSTFWRELIPPVKWVAALHELYPLGHPSTEAKAALHHQRKHDSSASRMWDADATAVIITKLVDSAVVVLRGMETVARYMREVAISSKEEQPIGAPGCSSMHRVACSSPSAPRSPSSSDVFAAIIAAVTRTLDCAVTSPLCRGAQRCAAMTSAPQSVKTYPLVSMRNAPASSGPHVAKRSRSCKTSVVKRPASSNSLDCPSSSTAVTLMRSAPCSDIVGWMRRVEKIKDKEADVRVSLLMEYHATWVCLAGQYLHGFVSVGSGFVMFDRSSRAENSRVGERSCGTDALPLIPHDNGEQASVRPDPIITPATMSFGSDMEYENRPRRLPLRRCLSGDSSVRRVPPCTRPLQQASSHAGDLQSRKLRGCHQREKNNTSSIAIPLAGRSAVVDTDYCLRREGPARDSLHGNVNTDTRPCVALSKSPARVVNWSPECGMDSVSSSVFPEGNRCAKHESGVDADGGDRAYRAESPMSIQISQSGDKTIFSPDVCEVSPVAVEESANSQQTTREQLAAPSWDSPLSSLSQSFKEALEFYGTDLVEKEVTVIRGHRDSENGGDLLSPPVAVELFCGGCLTPRSECFPAQFSPRCHMVALLSPASPSE